MSFFHRIGDAAVRVMASFMNLLIETFSRRKPSYDSDHPYRSAGKPEPSPVNLPTSPEEMVITCTTTGEAGRTEETIQALMVKTRRRAIRYFRGLDAKAASTDATVKEVKHRVKSKSDLEIEFAFFRRSGNPMHLKWRREPSAPAVTGQQ